MIKILSVLAHPDDEIIFGWPVFQNPLISNHLICATGIPNRLKALEASAQILGFTWECLNLPDGDIISHLPKIQEQVKTYVALNDPCIVFTHNPHGEYSHPDHINIFRAIHSCPEIKTILISDMSISLHGSGFPFTPLKIPDNEKSKFYKNAFCSIKRNEKIYTKVKRSYKHYKAWTWGKRTIDQCTLYFVRQGHTHRKYIIELLTLLYCPNKCMIAEIGVYKGGTTEYLAQCPNIGKIYAIDPWRNIAGYKDHHKLLKTARRQDTHGEYIPANNWEQIYQHVSTKLSIFKHVEIIRATSEEAAPQIEELDLVFIDGDHSFESVLMDLNLWSPKVKSGGIVSGHDYTWNLDGKDKRGLVRAVLKYFTEHQSEFMPPVDPNRNPVINRQSDRVWWQRKNG